MKKLIAKILTLVLSVTLILSMFAACDWVTNIDDRDMAQVVATVNISANTEVEEMKGKLNDDKIYKRDLVAGYMSYGYQYVTSYNYSTSKAYQLVLDNLISNKVVVQLARYSLAKGTNIELKYSDDSSKKGFDSSYVQHLKLYLSDYAYANAVYLVRASINSMVDTFVESEDETEEKEEFSVTPRTIPTKKTDDDNDEEALKTRKVTAYEIEVVKATLGYDEDGAEVPASFNFVAGESSVYDLNTYLFANYKIDFDSTKDRKKASSKLFDYLETNGLNTAGDKWAKGDAKKSDKDKYYDVSDPEKSFNCTYFTSLLVSRLENALISKYEESLVSGIEESELSVDGLWQQYKVEYATQEAQYRNNISGYESDLENVSDTSFVLYTPYVGSYGYVSNLLIGFSDAQSALLDAYSAKAGVTDADIEAYRENLLADLVAYDQRATWVQSNYGKYTEAEGKGSFAFDDDYRVSSLSSVANFIGTVTAVNAEGEKVEDSNGVKTPAWRYSAVTPEKIGFETFYNDYVNGVLGAAKYYSYDESVAEADQFGYVSGYNGDSSVFEISDEVYDQFCDLLFAFSTDPGCLNKEYGYLYSAFTSSEKYVKEFADAAKLVVSKGVGAYTIVATRFGYHIILCTKIVTAPYDVNNDAGKAQFEADLTADGTLAYNYREVKKNAVVSKQISKFVEKQINPYLDKENAQYAVKLFEKTYNKDLITETDED